MLLRPSFDGQLEAAHDVICITALRGQRSERRKGAAMGQFVRVGTRAELDELEGGKLVEVGGQKIAISITEDGVVVSDESADGLLT